RQEGDRPRVLEALREHFHAVVDDALGGARGTHQERRQHARSPPHRRPRASAVNSQPPAAAASIIASVPASERVAAMKVGTGEAASMKRNATHTPTAAAA